MIPPFAACQIYHPHVSFRYLAMCSHGICHDSHLVFEAWAKEFGSVFTVGLGPMAASVKWSQDPKEKPFFLLCLAASNQSS